MFENLFLHKYLIVYLSEQEFSVIKTANRTLKDFDSMIKEEIKEEKRRF